MSLILADLRLMGRGLASHVAAWVAALRRTTRAVVLLRLVVAGCLGVAGGLALPADLARSRTIAVPIALALVVAILPRTSAVTVALVTTGGLWVVSHPDPPLWNALAVAALLYVAHAAAALAAVVPYDCAVRRSALTGWVGRTGAVVAASGVLGAAGMVLAGEAPLAPGVAGPVAGSLVAAGIVAVLVWQLRRRA